MYTIKSEENEVIIQVLAAGIKKEQINIEAQDNYVSVELKEGNEWMYAFKKVFKLSERLKIEDLKAELTDGILSIVIPRKEESKSRKIEIM